MYVTIFFNPTVEVDHIPATWMVHAGIAYVASIHPSRT